MGFDIGPSPQESGGRDSDSSSGLEGWSLRGRGERGAAVNRATVPARFWQDCELRSFVSQQPWSEGLDSVPGSTA